MAVVTAPVAQAQAVAKSDLEHKPENVSAPSSQSQQQLPSVVPKQTNSQSSRQRRLKKPPVCRYFSTKKGCRAGEACPFLHVAPETTLVDAQADNAPSQDLVGEASSLTTENGKIDAVPESMPLILNSATTAARQHDTPVVTARAVSRPVSTAQVQDPRAFQMKQIKTRFAATEQPGPDSGTVLSFKMAPSDPDFPFEIEALECSLRIPLTFPVHQGPTLRITNREMERGYQINVERGFDAIWAQSKNSTLLGAMKMLDKQLETLLTAQKADTIKLVVNAGPAQKKQETAIKERQTPEEKPPQSATAQPVKRPAISSERREQARQKRKSETEMLEHRLNRHTQFTREADGTIYTVPIDPRKRNALPVLLQAVKAVRLFVPETYDLEPCAIELLGVDGDAAANVERAFSRRAIEHPEATILAHINYLAQNMHSMAAESAPMLTPPKQIETPKIVELVNPPTQQESRAPEISGSEQSHIKYIPRPPEWSLKPANEEEESSASDSEYTTSEDAEDDESETEEKEIEQVQSDNSSGVKEKGVLISFPHMELYSVELLELTSPNITVKCERCKDTMDITRLKNNDKGDYTGVRSESCKKCAFSFGIGYRKDLMHLNSIRAGYLDLDGCTVVDLLPSNFTPTCSECSTPFPSPGIVAVRGDSATAICRECHHKMSFRIPEVKFLNVGASAVHANRGLPRKKPKENLGIVAGQELPRRGRCTHYSKSYRWFRFSCCSKVFPCDRCHDEATDHLNEFANRMLCGFCSREQNYRPEDCGICHSPLTGKTGSGFWEGGKGTRDPRRMSRKDPRKYKRRGGTAPRSTPKS